MSMENIKVAVRVRPFSTRETSRKAQLIVSMEQNTTKVADPANPKSGPKVFNYDHSYWSHDGYKVAEGGYFEPATKKYTDQNKVFNDLGLGMLDNAWKGYNCSIFAYGQTGSGKSYSIMGHGPNQGIVPRTCKELFERIDQNKKTNPEVSYEVTVSMLEIYNEKVRDLLNKKKTPQGGLKVKEAPNKGFHVDGLSVMPVGNYQDIKLRMDEGDRQRTIAATKMNETSSRAHTIVTVTFKQNEKKTKMTKHSSISLVDLAGSERADQTEATGDRFEEAKNINKSLMTLGNVIKGLCDQAKGTKGTHIPYRDAVLTKLLKNTLGGNSKTCMIAAISPDAENYEQTLSTLRYADRAKSIRTQAKVNEQATNKMIQDLIREKKRLLRELEGAKNKGISDEEMERLKEEKEEEILRYKDMMDDAERVWEKRLEDARKDLEEIKKKEEKAAEEEKKTPHLYNLNEDPMLTGKIRHMLRKGNLQLGNGKEGTAPEIVLNGPRIAKFHGNIVTEKGNVFLEPVVGQVMHNGIEINKRVQLQHQDRIRFGSNNLFVFAHPTEAAQLKAKGKPLRDITYEFAQSEIAKNAGLNLSSEDGIPQEEVMSLMQMVQDVNAMAEDMDKPVDFAILLVSAEARGLESGRTEVYVKVVDQTNENEYLWSKNRFLNRQVHMQEMYQQFEETDQVPDVPQDKDPFYELPSTEVVVGVVTVPLNYLAHMLEFQDEPLTIIDYKAKQSGFLKVELLPCTEHGKHEDLCVEDPMDLVGKTIAFKIQVHQAMNIPKRFKKTWCRFKFYNDADYKTTKNAEGPNPKYDHEELFVFKKQSVTHKLIDYLREKSLVIEILGVQGEEAAGKAPRQKREELVAYKERCRTLEDLLGEIGDVIDNKSGSANDKVDRIRKLLTTRP